MPQEILVEPEAGQVVVVNPKGTTKILRTKISDTKLQAKVFVEGTFQELALIPDSNVLPYNLPR